MEIRNILVSQPKPVSDKSPYYDLEKKFGVTCTFKPLIRIEPLASKEFRQQKIYVPNFTAIVFTSRTAVDHFFHLAEELRVPKNEETQYFCLSESIALYLQKYINYRKRKVHHSKVGALSDLAQVMKKHHDEKFLMPISDIHKEDMAIFTKAKLNVTTAVMYRTVSAEFSAEELASYDMICIFTASGIQSIYDNNPDYTQGDQCLALFGTPTITAAQERNLRIDIQAPSPECPSMPAAIQNYLQNK